MQLTPTHIQPYSATELLIGWSDQLKYALPYVEVRYYCPCAGCVDEHSGARKIQKMNISPDIRPVAVRLVGRYAVQISWSDRHDTGIYHFDRLQELCEKQGRKLEGLTQETSI